MEPMEQLRLSLDGLLAKRSEAIEVFTVLVTGWRFWPRSSASRVWHELGKVRMTVPSYIVLRVMEGACPYDGVDLYAYEWAEASKFAKQNVEPQRIPADWGVYGRAAGPIRNQQMVNRSPDLVLAFPQFALKDDYRGKPSGTHDCMNRAKAAGIPIETFPWVTS